MVKVQSSTMGLNILTQVSVGGGVTCKPAVLLELLYSLLMAASSYPTPPQKCALFRAKRVHCHMCVQSYIQKLQEYYFAVLIYKFFDLCERQGRRIILL